MIANDEMNHELKLRQRMFLLNRPPVLLHRGGQPVVAGRHPAAEGGVPRPRRLLADGAPRGALLQHAVPPQRGQLRPIAALQGRRVCWILSLDRCKLDSTR